MCFRSGTYASIVLGKLKGVKTVSDLVDTIVSMREHRDGLVEIPSQLRYACRLLGMDDPTHCGWACQVSRKVFAEKYLFSTSIQDISKGGILHWSPSPILLRNVNGAIDVDNGLFVLLLLSMLWSLLFGLLISNFLMTDFFRAKRCSKAFQLILFVCLSMIYILTLNSI